MSDFVLAKIDKARRLLAEAKTVQEAKQIADVAEAARVYAKRVEASIITVNHAAEIKIRAERLLGEMLKQTPKNKGRLRRSSVAAPRDDKQRLKEVGVSKKQSARSQKLASIPAPEFEHAIEEQKEAGKEISTAGVLRVLAPSETPAARENFDLIQCKCHWRRLGRKHIRAFLDWALTKPSANWLEEEFPAALAAKKKTAAARTAAGLNPTNELMQQIPTVKGSVKLITPELAARLLEGNKNNRHLRESVVDAYAQDMLNGHWLLNNQGIGLGEDGSVIDGQHRLAAVVKSGCSVRMLVVGNLPVMGGSNGVKLRTVDTVDTGIVRHPRLMRPDKNSDFYLNCFFGWDTFLRTHGHYHADCIRTFGAAMLGWSTGGRRYAHTALRHSFDYVAEDVRKTCVQFSIPLWPAVIPNHASAISDHASP